MAGAQSLMYSKTSHAPGFKTFFSALWAKAKRSFPADSSLTTPRPFAPIRGTGPAI